MALTDEQGVVSTSGDNESGKFTVTFITGQACPGRLGTKLVGVSPEVRLLGVEAADGTLGEAGGCGGCPKKNECGKH